MKIINIVFDVSALKYIEKVVKERQCNIYDLLISIIERIANKQGIDPGDVRALRLIYTDKLKNLYRDYAREVFEKLESRAGRYLKGSCRLLIKELRISNYTSNNICSQLIEALTELLTQRRGPERSEHTRTSAEEDASFIAVTSYKVLHEDRHDKIYIISMSFHVELFQSIKQFIENYLNVRECSYTVLEARDLF